MRLIEPGLYECGRYHDSLFILFHGSLNESQWPNCSTSRRGPLRLDPGHNLLTQTLGPHKTVVFSFWEYHDNLKHPAQGCFPTTSPSHPQTYTLGQSWSFLCFLGTATLQKDVFTASGLQLPCWGGAWSPEISLLNSCVLKWSFTQRGLICQPYIFIALKEWKKCLLLNTTFTALFSLLEEIDPASFWKLVNSSHLFGEQISFQVFGKLESLTQGCWVMLLLSANITCS